jgi:hypothetical protein
MDLDALSTEIAAHYVWADLEKPTSDKSLTDRAHEWVTTNYPDAEGEEYERLLIAAEQEIADLDRDEDERAQDLLDWYGDESAEIDGEAMAERALTMREAGF